MSSFVKGTFFFFRFLKWECIVLLLNYILCFQCCFKGSLLVTSIFLQCEDWLLWTSVQEPQAPEPRFHSAAAAVFSLLVYLLLFLILWVHTCGCRYPCLWCHLLILQFFFFFWYFCLGLWTRMLTSSTVGQQAPGVLLYPTFSTRITHTTTMPNYLVGFWASKLRFPYLKGKYSTHWAIPSAGIYVKIHFANYKIHLSILGDSVIYYIHNIVL